MRKLLLYFLAAVTLGLGACSSQDEVLPDEKPVIDFKKVKFKLSVNNKDADPLTRAVKTGWEDGDLLYFFFEVPGSQEINCFELYYGIDEETGAGEWCWNDYTPSDATTDLFEDIFTNGANYPFRAIYCPKPIYNEDKGEWFSSVSNWQATPDRNGFFTPIIDDYAIPTINTDYLNFAQYSLITEGTCSYEISEDSYGYPTFKADILLVNNYAQICIQGGAEALHDGERATLTVGDHNYVPYPFYGYMLNEGFAIGQIPGLDDAPCFVYGDDLYCWVQRNEQEKKESTFNTLTLNILNETSGELTCQAVYQMPSTKTLKAGQAVKMGIGKFVPTDPSVDRGYVSDIPEFWGDWDWETDWGQAQS